MTANKETVNSLMTREVCHTASTRRMVSSDDSTVSGPVSSEQSLAGIEIKLVLHLARQSFAPVATRSLPMNNALNGFADVVHQHRQVAAALVDEIHRTVMNAPAPTVGGHLPCDRNE